MSGSLIFKKPRYSGKISVLIRVWEYFRLIDTLQVLADSMGTGWEECIGNTEGNFFFRINLKKTGKVSVYYEFCEDHRLVETNKPIFRGNFSTDHLHIGPWLAQAKEDLAVALSGYEHVELQ